MISPTPNKIAPGDSDAELDRLLSEGANSFRDFVIRAKGRYPTELLQHLARHPKGDDPVGRLVRAMMLEAKAQANTPGLPQGKGLALPHPIDAEWRFTEQTAEKLIEAAVATTVAGDTILLMGVPSVVLAAAQSSENRHFCMIGEANVITEELKSLTAQDSRFVHGDAAPDHAVAAILDPPWYVDQFRSMLGKASQSCRIGAHIFVSAPPEGVRPSIPDDLHLIAEAAGKSGLEVVGQTFGALTYRTPFFELNALRAAGIRAWLPDWRRSNLTTYRKRSNGNFWPSASTKPAGFELTLSGVRFRLLNSGRKEGVPELTPLHDGEIFPSVSIRAPRRAEATFWTSGNRAFRVTFDLALAAMTTMAQARQLLPKRLDSKPSLIGNPNSIDAVESLIQKLTELADREFAEAASILGPAAWETSANDARFLSAS